MAGAKLVGALQVTEKPDTLTERQLAGLALDPLFGASVLALSFGRLSSFLCVAIASDPASHHDNQIAKCDNGDGRRNQPQYLTSNPPSVKGKRPRMSAATTASRMAFSKVVITEPNGRSTQSAFKKFGLRAGVDLYRAGDIIPVDQETANMSRFWNGDQGVRGVIYLT